MVSSLLLSAYGTDTSDPRHFGTGAEVSWTYRHHLDFVHRSVTLIYVFKKDYFIDDMTHISVLFIFYITKVFCTNKPAYTKQN